MCACVGCSNRWPRNKEKSFFRLPSVIVHQGEQTRALIERTQREWLAAIKRQDENPENLQYTRVCSDLVNLVRFMIILTQIGSPLRIWDKMMLAVVNHQDMNGLGVGKQKERNYRK